MTFPWLVAGVLGTAFMATAFAHRTRLYFVAAVAASAAILLMQNGYFHYTSDDAYISFRYARNLADGQGLAWNPGEYVEGYTNFLWVVLLAALHKLGADIVPTARWLGFALALASAAGTYALVLELTDAPARRVAGLAAAILLASSGTWAVWTFAGLEAPLFAALALAAVLLHLRERPSSPLPPSGIVWAFVAMTRPEGLVLFAVSGAFKLADFWRATRERESTSVRVLLSAAIWAAGFAAVYLPYFAWRYATYGWLFPNTYYAKVGSGLDQYERGLRYAWTFLSEYGGVMLLAAPAAIALQAVDARRMLYVFALVAAWIAVTVYVGGDSLARFRLFAPVMPLYVTAIIAPVSAIASRSTAAVTTNARARPPIIAIVLVGTAALMLYPSAAGATSGFLFEGERRAVTERAQYGRWLRQHVPPGTTVAVIPAGAIPYESQLPVIDMLGLNDEHIAHRDISIGAFPAGHEKYDTEYVLDKRPQVIVLVDQYAPKPFAREDYRANGVFGAALIPAFADLLRNERLWNEYEPRAVQLGPGRWLNMLVRNDAEAVKSVTQAVPP